MTKNKIKKIIEYFAIVIIGLVIILGGATVAFGYQYRNKFYPGVNVGGINLSGVLQEEGLTKVQTEVDTLQNHKIVVTIPQINQPRNLDTNLYPELEIATDAKGLGLSIGSTSSVKEAWDLGHNYHSMNWFRQAYQSLTKGMQWSLKYSIDGKITEEFINTQVVPKTIAPVPAKIAINVDKVEISQAASGLSVDNNKLTDQLVKLLGDISDNTTSYLRAPVSEVEPTVTYKTLEPIATQWQSLSDLKVYLTQADKTFTPNKTTLMNFFETNMNDKNEVSLVVNKDNVDKYVGTLSKSVATDQVLDRTKSTNALVKNLGNVLVSTTSTSAVSLALVTTKKTEAIAVNAVPGQYTAGLYPGKYIEISLGDQKMYLINGEALEQSYTVSSGKWSTPTPVGTFSIHSKIDRAYSREFGLYMPYWENFLNGEYGIHGLPEWPNGYKEGENHLGIPVSHGCVRLGAGADVFVYNWTEIGTPVVIHQ